MGVDRPNKTFDTPLKTKMTGWWRELLTVDGEKFPSIFCWLHSRKQRWQWKIHIITCLIGNTSAFIIHGGFSIDMLVFDWYLAWRVFVNTYNDFGLAAWKNSQIMFRGHVTFGRVQAWICSQKLQTNEAQTYCWWGTNPAPVEGKVVEIPLFQGVRSHPTGGCLGCLNHQQYHSLKWCWIMVIHRINHLPTTENKKQVHPQKLIWTPCTPPLVERKFLQTKAINFLDIFRVQSFVLERHWHPRDP